MNLKNLSDDNLCQQFADELFELRGSLNNLSDVVKNNAGDQYNDTLRDALASIDRAAALHAELVARGVVA